MEFNHASVMLNECIDNLQLKEGGTYVDCTLGGAGHSLEIARHIGKGGRLIAFDKDGDALEFSQRRLKDFGKVVTFVHDDFKNAVNVLGKLDVMEIDGFLMDLGVSSFQLDNRVERGFSYLGDNRLDMRMDQRQALSAYEVVNDYSQKELEMILFEYGEEKFARSIASNIARQRQTGKIESTKQLVDIIERSIPAKVRFTGGHSAKKTFQGIRIAVNGELTGLKESIVGLVEMLKPRGRAAILTFHSLEARIVKQTFKELSTACVCPPKTPICICGKKALVKLPYNKPITASEQELKENSRSKSAELRVAERI
jgi:16S rRNA (cytosine1402-N4)-methyltransferase